MAAVGHETDNSEEDSMDIEQDSEVTGHLVTFKLQFDQQDVQQFEIRKKVFQKSLQKWCNKQKRGLEVKEILNDRIEDIVKIEFTSMKAAEFCKSIRQLEVSIKDQPIVLTVVEGASSSGKSQVETAIDENLRILESEEKMLHVKTAKNENIQNTDLPDLQFKNKTCHKNSDKATQDSRGNAAFLDLDKRSLSNYNNEYKIKRNRTEMNELDTIQDEKEMIINSDSNNLSIDYYQYDYFIKAYSDEIDELVKKGNVHLSPKVVLTVTSADRNADTHSIEKAKQDFTKLIQSKVTNLKQEKVIVSKAQRKAIRKAFLDIEEKFCRVILNEIEEGFTLIGPTEDVALVKEKLETFDIPGQRGNFTIKTEGSLLQKEIDIPSLHWKFLKKIYGRYLEEIEARFGVKFIPQEETLPGKQKICLQPQSEEYNVTGHALQAFTELYQKAATNLIQRSVKNADAVCAREAYQKIENKHPNVEVKEKNGEFHLIGHHHHITLEIEKMTKFTNTSPFKDLPEIGKLEQFPSKAGCKSKMKDETGATDRSAEEESCPICLDSFKDKFTLSCQHSFCKVCWEEAKKHKPVCPVCKTVLGKVKGNQPKGTMKVNCSSAPLPGYSCSTIEIHYYFANGRQSAEHPKPGQWYEGTNRTAYLPDNKEGNEVLTLLHQAFDQGLIFTIGTSRTTGNENVVTWNDIHHKTNRYGGPQNYGYPDPSYLTRVKEELKAKGIE